MADTKITYSEALAKAIAFEGMDAEVVAKLTALKASLEKKSANRKPTKEQKENEGIKEILVASLAEGKGTATEIAKRNEATADLSNQKVASLLKQLVEAGKVAKATEGRKSIFSLV